MTVLTFRWKYCCCIWNNLHIPLLNRMFEVCGDIKKLKTSYHMLKCMYSQNWWLDHTTLSPSDVICDLLFYNKLPYHIILTGRSNHACKKQSNYSPLLSKKSSIPTSSLNKMQGHKSIVNFLQEFWTLVATKSYLNSFIVSTNAFLSLTVSYKALSDEE